MCPAAHQPPHSLQSPCHCEASAHTGCGNPYPQRLPTQGEPFSVGATLAVARGRGNRRSAAGGGGSEAISRKCPDWRPRQWPGIGWHNGGQESPSPTHHKIRFRRGRCLHRPESSFPAPTAGHTGPALQGVALSGLGGQLPAVRRGGVLPRPHPAPSITSP